MVPLVAGGVLQEAINGCGVNKSNKTGQSGYVLLRAPIPSVGVCV